MSSKKPIEESIFIAIKLCDEHSAYLVAELIKGTNITKNHEAIIKAWEEKMHKLKFDDFDVPESVLKNKKLHLGPVSLDVSKTALKEKKLRLKRE